MSKSNGTTKANRAAAAAIPAAAPPAAPDMQQMMAMMMQMMASMQGGNPAIAQQAAAIGNGTAATGIAAAAPSPQLVNPLLALEVGRIDRTAVKRTFKGKRENYESVSPLDDAVRMALHDALTDSMPTIVISATVNGHTVEMGQLDIDPLSWGTDVNGNRCIDENTPLRYIGTLDLPITAAVGGIGCDLETSCTVQNGKSFVKVVGVKRNN